MRHLRLTLLVGTLLAGFETEAAERIFAPESAGLRWGMGAGTSSRHFNQFEFFGDWMLPLRLDRQGWRLETLAQISAGLLWEGGRSGAIGSLGPAFRIGGDRFPVFLEVGISPTVLGRIHYEAKQLGTGIQFTSHIGVAWDITRRARFGYRLQHMSNAGLSDWNPGLNLHILALSYRF